MREEGGERRDSGIFCSEAKRERGSGGAVEVKPALGDERNGGG